MSVERCILRVGHGGTHLYLKDWSPLWFECGRTKSVKVSQEESLALWEQAEDDEFRSSLVECMDELDKEVIGE